MRRAAIVLPLIIVALFNLIGATAHAEGGPPAPDATPGAVGITGIPLGGLEPSAAPGSQVSSTTSRR